MCYNYLYCKNQISRVHWINSSIRVMKTNRKTKANRYRNDSKANSTVLMSLFSFLFFVFHLVASCSDHISILPFYVPSRLLVSNFTQHIMYFEGMTFSEPHVIWQVLVQQNAECCFNSRIIAHLLIFREVALYSIVSNKTLYFTYFLFLISVLPHLCF